MSLFGSKYDVVLGVDHGNGHVKIARKTGRGIETFKVPSAIAKYEDVKDPEDANYNKSLTTYESSKFLGEKYVIGEEIVDYKNLKTRGIGAKRYESKTYQLLTEFVLEKFVEDGQNVLVITGVPANEASSDTAKESIASAFKGKHTVKVSGKEKTFNVDVKVRSQPFGTYAYELLDNEGIPTNKIQKDDYVGIIDVGNFTVDTSGLLKGKGVAGDVLSHTGGMSTVTKKLNDYIMEKLGGGKEISEFKIEKTLEEGKTVFKRGMDQVDIKEAIEKAVKDAGDYMIADLDARWTNKDEFTKIILTGGGAKLLGDYLQKNWNKPIIIVQDPQFANCNGFLRFGISGLKIAAKKGQ